MMVAAGCGMGEAAYNPYTGEYEDSSGGGSVLPYTSIYTPEPGGPEIPKVDTSTYLNPGTYATSGGRSVQFGGGSSDALAKLLAPVVPGVMNLVTAMYSPPAYETVTGPGGSRTTIRVPGTVTGQPPQTVAGINTNTIMIVAAVAVAMLMMNRR